MKYHNRVIPEGINVSNEHPLKEFTSLLIGLCLLLALAVASLAILAEWLAPYIPFERESRLASSFFAESPEPGTDDHAHKEAYLQELASRLAAQMELPEEITLHVHFSDDPVVNAYASLGGNIVLNKGLLAQQTQLIANDC